MTVRMMNMAAAVQGVVGVVVRVAAVGTGLLGHASARLTHPRDQRNVPGTTDEAPRLMPSLRRMVAVPRGACP